VRHVAAVVLRGFIRDALLECDLPSEHAAEVADLMTEADLTGADAHGVFRLPQYVEGLRSGRINARPAMRLANAA